MGAGGKVWRFLKCPSLVLGVRHGAEEWDGKDVTTSTCPVSFNMQIICVCFSHHPPWEQKAHVLKITVLEKVLRQRSLVKKHSAKNGVFVEADLREKSPVHGSRHRQVLRLYPHLTVCRELTWPSWLQVSCFLINMFAAIIHCVWPWEELALCIVLF